MSSGGGGKQNVGMLALCRWLLRYALRRRVGMAVVVLSMFLRTGVDLLKPWPMKVLIDHALGDKAPPAWLAGVLNTLPSGSTARGVVVWCVFATVILFLLAWAIGVASAIANGGFGQRLAYDLAADLYSHLQCLSLRFHGRRPVGDSIRRVTTDCGCVSTIVKDALLPAATSAVMLVLMFVVLWRLNSTLALMALWVVPFMAWVFRRYSDPMLQAGYHQQEVEGRMYTVVEQTLSSIPVVQAFAREEQADREFRRSTEASLEATLNTTRLQLRFKILMGLATAAGTAVILGVGGWQTLEGRLTVGHLLVFLSYLQSLYSPLESLAYTSSTIQGAAGSARRVMEVLESEPEVRDAPHASPVGAVRGEVRFEDVSFGYEPGREVLSGVSLAARPGEVVAVVGPTGAGKSTLAGLIPRLFDPWSGQVTLDGRDLRGLRLLELREKVALVLQEPFLFPVSVAVNIAYGRPSATIEQVEAAARAANAHEFIVALPQGYQTVLGERGATLSGGQRQRLSIARALLKDAPVLVMDEPTSALDGATERLLMEAVGRLMAGRTTFVIAHRLSTIRGADQILVLDGGRVVERGRHAELAAAGGLYSRLWGSMLPETVEEGLLQ